MRRVGTALYSAAVREKGLLRPRAHHQLRLYPERRNRTGRRSAKPFLETVARRGSKLTTLGFAHSEGTALNTYQSAPSLPRNSEEEDSL
jgi:hypothetical protein